MGSILQLKDEYILQEADKLCSEYIAELESYSHDYPVSELQTADMDKSELYAYLRECNKQVQLYDKALHILRNASALKGESEPYNTAILYAESMKKNYVAEKRATRKKLYA